LLTQRLVIYCLKGEAFPFMEFSLYGVFPFFPDVKWASLGLGVRPYYSSVRQCQVSIKNTIMEAQQKEDPQYPANEGAKISGTVHVTW